MNCQQAAQKYQDARNGTLIDTENDLKIAHLEGSKFAVDQLTEEFFLNVVDEWKMFWMNQKQNSEDDYQNYFRRALGVDANMMHHLASEMRKFVLQKMEGTDAQYRTKDD